MTTEILRHEYTEALKRAMAVTGVEDISAQQNAWNDVKRAETRLAKAMGDEQLTGKIKQLTGGMAPTRTMHGGRASGQSLGAQFMASNVFEFLSKHRGKFPAGQWTSPDAELEYPGMMATTLDSSSGSGGQLIVNDYQPGIVQLPTRPLRIEQLLMSGNTDSNTVAYMRETAFTNAAAPVAEGAQKPESTLTFDAATDPVRKIPHWIPVTDEMLEDVSGFQAYIEARLRLGVDLAADDQLLNGNGTDPNLTGLLHRSGLAADVTRTGTEINADAILDQIVAIENATNLAVDAIVMNPLNWRTIQKSKDGEGRYYGGGPLGSPMRPILWGRPVAVTSVITANTALVGAFGTAAQVFSKGGIRVEASNSHQDFFVRNLQAIRAERRLALAVYRPAAFGKVLGLT